MSDIASLGIRIDSTQVVRGTGALDQFAAAGKNAATSASAVEKAAAKGGNAIATAGGLARHEMINLSRQIQDVGVSLASGQSPFMVLAQQGTQIADIFGSSKTGSVGGALRQIVGGIGAVRLAALGIGGAAIGGLFAVKGIADSAKAFDDLARSIGATRGQVQSLQQAAAFKGIAGDDFTKAFEKWGADIYQAKNNMGGLADVMRANGKSAKDFNGFLESAADLIKNAKDDQQRLALLQQMGLPATMEWVRFLSQGAAGIKAATAEAVKFNESAEGKLIDSARRFDEAWNRSTTKVVNYFKAGMLEIVGAMSGVQVPQWLTNIARGAAGGVLGGPLGMIAGGIRGGAQGNTASFDDRFGSFATTGNQSALQQGLTNRANQANGTPSSVDPTARQREISLEQQRLGLLGQTMTATEAMRQIDLQAQAARLAGVTVDQKRVDILKQLAAEQVLGISAIKASTDAQNVETATIGMGVGQATAYAAAQNAINEARRAGRELTPGNIAAIQAEAQALGNAAQRADDMRWSYENLVRGPLQTFRAALAQGASGFDALKKAGASALDAISSRLMDMASRSLWQAAFPSGGGGILSALFGGGGGGLDANGMAVGVNHTGYGPGDSFPKRYVHPAYFDDAPKFHGGIGPGERAAIIRNDESVLTPGQMKAMGGAAGPSVVIHQNNDFRGADPGSEARLRQAIEKSKDVAVREAVQAVAGIQSTNPAYGKARR